METLIVLITLASDRIGKIITAYSAPLALDGDRIAKLLVEEREHISRLEAELIGETKTQDATIARLQAQVNNARSEYNRHQQLYRVFITNV